MPRSTESGRGAGRQLENEEQHEKKEEERKRSLTTVSRVGVVVITSALHAEGRGFEPRTLYV